MWKWSVIFILTLSLESPGFCIDYDGILSDAKSRAIAGDFTTAISLCNGVINQHPGAPAEPKALLLIAKILNKKQCPASEAIGQFAQVAERFPDSPETPEALLRIGYLRDRLKQQPAEWDRIVADYPRTKEAAEALHCLGHLALRAGDPMRAAARFRASAAVVEAEQSIVYDSLTEAGYAFISSYWQSRNIEALPMAIMYFKRVEAEVTEQAVQNKARMGLGEVYLIQGFYDRAITEYREVLDSSPSEPYTRALAQFEIGCCLYGKQDYEGSISAFDVFTASCPGGDLKAKDVAWKAARPGYADLVTKDPQNAPKLCGLDLVTEAVCRKSLGLVKLKRYGEASQLAEQMLKEFPNSSCVQRAKEVRDLCVAAGRQ